MRRNGVTPGPFAEIAGARLRYEYTDPDATGTPLVFIHAFSLDRRMWNGAYAVLAGRAPILRYDCRGFGESSLPEGGKPVDYTHGGDLVALLDCLDIDRVDLVGLSMGGQIALELAVDHPERVRSMILAGPWLVDFPYAAEWKGLWSSIAAEGARGDRDAARRIWIERGPFGPALENPDVADDLRTMVNEYSGWHFENIRHNPYRPVSERLNGIAAPTLVVAGERDWPDFHAVADRIAARIPAARKEMISGAGHLVGMESPRRFTEFLAGFPDMPPARGTVPGPSRCE